MKKSNFTHGLRIVLLLGVSVLVGASMVEVAGASTTSASSTWPIGIASAAEPSGYAPPGSLSGYTQSYSTDFSGSALPSEWDGYSGKPGGDVGGQFALSQLSVSGGVLNIATSLAPGSSTQWLTGGTCLCGQAGQTYGAFFVRSRLSGAGPTGVELLWPDSNAWPPEIDFNETGGGTTGTTATVHWTSSSNYNSIEQSSVRVDMTQWHTWGVIWTPTKITYTLDGTVFGQVTNVAEIPTIPMHISLQSQTWCNSGWACPTQNESMLVDWVTEYTPVVGDSSTTTTLPSGPVSTTTAVTTTTVATTSSTTSTTSTTVPVTVASHNTARRVLSPGTASVQGGGVNGKEAWINWASGGAVTQLSAALYLNSTCHSVVAGSHTAVRTRAALHGQVHFSRTVSTRAVVVSARASRHIYTRIVSLSGPGGRGQASACTLIHQA